jgi:hypothetical protein
LWARWRSIFQTWSVPQAFTKIQQTYFSKSAFDFVFPCPPSYHKIEVNVFTQALQVREMAEWDSLRRRNIITGLHTSSLQHLNLSDDLLWTSYVTMESFQPDLENIIVALQSNRSLKKISISWDVLIAIGESDQGRLFCSLGNLPTLQRMSVWEGTGSPTTIHTRVLTDALSESSNGIVTLKLLGFKISSRSEVEQLARGLKARVTSLAFFTLKDIVLDAQDRTGFLDPILLALTPVPGEPRRQLCHLRLSCVEGASNGASVVSPEALGAFFAEEPIETPGGTFILNHLGLNDNHCEVMAQELARHDALLRPIRHLDLTGNPSIGQKGYEVLLGLLNRRFDIGYLMVDDQNWKATFDMVIFMNLEDQRGRFLENGVFPLKAMWVNFLAKLASTRHYGSSDAQKLNAIWHTLREDPDLI